MNARVAPVETPERTGGTDRLRHLFCECGMLEAPWRARCGKRASKGWLPLTHIKISEAPDLCIVCLDGREQKCEGCGQ